MKAFYFSFFQRALLCTLSLFSFSLLAQSLQKKYTSLGEKNIWNRYQDVKTDSSLAPTLATEFEKEMRSPRIQRELEKEYFLKLRSFLYFHGYDATSSDIFYRKVHGLNEVEEYQVRKEVAQSLTNYFFIRALPEFLKNNPKTKHLGIMYNKVQSAAQIKKKIKLKNNKSITISSGLRGIDGKLHLIVKNKKNYFKTELISFRNSKFNPYVISDFSRIIPKRDLSLGLRYNQDLNSVAPYVIYKASTETEISFYSAVNYQAKQYRPVINFRYDF